MANFVILVEHRYENLMTLRKPLPPHRSKTRENSKTTAKPRGLQMRVLLSFTTTTG